MARITKEARKTITNISAAIRKFEQDRKDNPFNSEFNA